MRTPIRMNLLKRSHCMPALLITFCGTCCGTLLGQNTAEPTDFNDDEEIFELSPFEVTADKSQGYSAATSLAGNRLNTDLRDVGSAISVVTSQMLTDLGATSNETLLQYTTNTEVGNIYGNMANAGSGTQLDETSNFMSPNSNTRVRGLGSADNTIDYFLSEIPWDSYNVERIDMQRGPNAILFGLGSPAGIINAGTKSATFEDAGNIEFRYSRFGSMRTTIDYNKVLLPDELGVRITALNNEEKFQQDPAFQNDRRIYSTVRYEPAFLNKGESHTTLKASYETGKIRSNRPRSLTPGDAITPWFLSGTAQGYNSAGESITYNNPDRRGFNAIGLQDTNFASTGIENRGEFVSAYSPSGEQNPNWQPWLGGQFAAGGYDNPLAIFDSGASGGSHMMIAQPTTPYGLAADGSIDGNISGMPFGRMSSLTIFRDISKKVNMPGAKFGLTRNLTLSDPTVFDFYNQLIDGENKKEWQNFDRANASIAQTFSGGDFGFEAAFDRQNYDNGQLVFMGDKGQALYVDVIDTLADGTANPNFGRPFIADYAGRSNSSDITRDSLRLTAFAKHDFMDKGDDSILRRLLGKQIVTGLYSEDSRESDFRNWMRYGTDLAYKDVVGRSTDTRAIDNGLRSIYPVVYLGGSLADMTSPSGAYIPNPTTQQIANSGTVRVFDSTWTASGVDPGDAWVNTNYPVGNALRTSTESENPANYRGWINTPISVLDSEDGNRDALTKSAQLTRSEVESQAFIWQGYFWDGAVVGTYGYREDTASAWSRQADRNSLNQVNLDPTSYRLPNSGNVVEDSSSSWSVVAHLNDLFERKLPLNVSVFYNQSENFQPLAGRVDALGRLLTPPSGDTKDFGLILETLDGKYSVRINKYESTVTNASLSGLNPFLLGQLQTLGGNWSNIYEYQLGGYTMETANQGDPSRWTYSPKAGQTQTEANAEQAASVASWREFQASVPSEFFSAWSIPINEIEELSYSSPIGFAQTEDDISKGYELELYAKPTKNLRLTLNAAKSEAVRNNVGGVELGQIVELYNNALNNTPAGDLRFGSDATETTALQDWNASFYASYKSIKVQEGNAVPELRKWRFNMIANYDFVDGALKGVNIGGAYRWQDKVIVGYTPVLNNANPALATDVTFDLDKPYYGPSEGTVDFWAGYHRPINDKIDWRLQLNVRNAFGKEELIPVTVQPDGTPAAWRIAPAMVWSISNSFEF